MLGSSYDIVFQFADRKITGGALSGYFPTGSIHQTLYNEDGFFRHSGINFRLRVIYSNDFILVAVCRSVGRFLRDGTRTGMETNLNLRKLLTLKVAEILRQGALLLSEIDDSLYTKAETGAVADGGGAVGGHFRHCLEFVNCFLGGIKTGRVDYDRRERNHLLETSRPDALAEFKKTIQILEIFQFEKNGGALLVKPEDVGGGDEDESGGWCESSIERELEFLQSHTIHHYALIGFKLRSFGVNLPADFGVAPSTLRFWKERESAAS